MRPTPEVPPPFYRGGTGSPLVLLHGFTDTWRTWRTTIPLLEPHHDVFAPTLPGHWGYGPWSPPDVLSEERIVDDIVNLLDAHGIEKAHIAGNSLGGWLALHLAERGRALSVVALCPAGGWTHLGPDDRRIVKYFARAYRRSRFATRNAGFIANHRWSRRFAYRELVAKPGELDPETAKNGIYGMAGCSVVPLALTFQREHGFGELGTIDCPVRIAWGSEDRLIRWPSCYERWSALLPDAEFVRMEGVGHIPMWDDPDLTARTILDVTLAASAPAGAGRSTAKS